MCRVSGCVGCVGVRAAAPDTKFCPVFAHYTALVYNEDLPEETCTTWGGEEPFGQSGGIRDRLWGIGGSPWQRGRQNGRQPQQEHHRYAPKQLPRTATHLLGQLYNRDTKASPVTTGTQLDICKDNSGNWSTRASAGTPRTQGHLLGQQGHKDIHRDNMDTGYLHGQQRHEDIYRGNRDTKTSAGATGTQLDIYRDNRDARTSAGTQEHLQG